MSIAPDSPEVTPSAEVEPYRVPQEIARIKTPEMARRERQEMAERKRARMAERKARENEQQARHNEWQAEMAVTERRQIEELRQRYSGGDHLKDMIQSCHLSNQAIIDEMAPEPERPDSVRWNRPDPGYDLGKTEGDQVQAIQYVLEADADIAGICLARYTNKIVEVRFDLGQAVEIKTVAALRELLQRIERAEDDDNRLFWEYHSELGFFGGYLPSWPSDKAMAAVLADQWLDYLDPLAEILAPNLNDDDDPQVEMGQRDSGTVEQKALSPAEILSHGLSHEVSQLSQAGQSVRQIADKLGISKSKVARILKSARS